MADPAFSNCLLPLPLSPRFVYCLFPVWNFALKPLLAAATALSPKLSPKLPLFWWISFSAALGCRCHFVCQEVLQIAKQVFFWIVFGVTRRKKGTGEACRNATCRHSIKGTRGDRGRRGRNRRRRGRSKGSLAARVKLAFLTFARRIFHCLRACGDTVTTNSLWSLCLADFFRRVGTHNLLRAFLLPILQWCNWYALTPTTSNKTHCLSRLATSLNAAMYCSFHSPTLLSCPCLVSLLFPFCLPWRLQLPGLQQQRQQVYGHSLQWKTQCKKTCPHHLIRHHRDPIYVLAIWGLCCCNCCI